MAYNFFGCFVLLQLIKRRTGIQCRQVDKMAAYQLRCQLFGHEKDVRAVTAAVYPENAIVSGSRDITARVWVPQE